MYYIHVCIAEGDVAIVSLGWFPSVSGLAVEGELSLMLRMCF